MASNSLYYHIKRGNKISNTAILGLEKAISYAEANINASVAL
jgi:hypothetical protein